VEFKLLNASAIAHGNNGILDDTVPNHNQRAFGS
jgi:hypothetical protein